MREKVLVEVATLLAISLVILFLSGERVVEYGKRLSLLMGVSSFTFGLLVVALGTSLPEITVSLVSALQGYTDVVVGDVLGSNVADLLFLVPVYALIGRWVVDSRLARHLISTASFAGMAFVYTLLRGSLTLLDGIVLLALFALFVRSRLPVVEMHESAEVNLPHDVAVFLLSLVALAASSYTAVKAVVVLAHILGVSPFVVSAITLAFGTSLPELAVGLNAIRRGEYHLALGDVVGSLVVNTTVGLGVPALFLNVDVLLWEERFGMFLLLLGIFFFVYSLARKEAIGTTDALLLLSLYAAFLAGILL